MAQKSVILGKKLPKWSLVRWRVGVTWLVFRRMGLLWWIVPWWKLISDFCKRDTCDVCFSIYHPPSKKKVAQLFVVWGGGGDSLERWHFLGGGGWWCYPIYVPFLRGDLHSCMLKASFLGRGMRIGEGGYVDEIAMMRRKDMAFFSSINSSSSFQGGYPT